MSLEERAALGTILYLYNFFQLIFENKFFIKKIKKILSKFKLANG
jgi:hypothetical protein